MRKEEIIFRLNQLVIVSVATAISDFESYIPICDLPYTRRSVLPKGAVYEIGAWNDNHTKFRLLRDFEKVVELKTESDNFEVKDFGEGYKKLNVKITAEHLVDGIPFEDINKANKILLRQGLQNFAESLSRGK